MYRPLVTEAVKNFLTANARPEFAERYSADMEVQVNVDRKGTRVDREENGRRWTVWTDEDQTQEWKDFRVPYKANTQPEYNDFPIKFDLAEHAEGIGMTGWDWKNKKSLWFAYDFDAIMGHSEKHTQKLSDDELEAVRVTACSIPWVTVRKSTSGNGLHLYVDIVPTDTENHTEHAAIARAILFKMSSLTGFDFASKVDNCGGIMWVWHTKFEKAGGINGPGLKLDKQGEVLEKIPVNWRDHLRVTKGKRARTLPTTLIGDSEKEGTTFEQMCSKYPKVVTDESHRAVMSFLDTLDYDWWWDADHHMMVCHTAALKKAHTFLQLRGLFDTMAEGKEAGDQNCFAFPQRDGVWVVRRHTPGVQEAVTWGRDAAGWTVCYLNRDPDLATVALASDGAEDENGSFVFAKASDALRAAKLLGVEVQLEENVFVREAILKSHKDGRLIFEISRNNDDNNASWHGWVNKKSKWRKVFNVKLPGKFEQEVSDMDDMLRHLVCDKGDAGWVFRPDAVWKEESSTNIKLALRAMGNAPKEADLIMGQSVINRWSLVNQPFQPEYLGDRNWNRDAAQFAVVPSQDVDSLRYPTWTSLLEHCGFSLTKAILQHDWCKENNITTGGEYLLHWVAAMFQEPFEPLPYLFLYGDQGTGKTILHEALSLLMTRGVQRADTALISTSGFNGELMSAILCVVEETDLGTNKSSAYNRIKDWVTGGQINIHVKNMTPFMADNATHWIQCANDREFCPIFPGDTRIVMVHVFALAKNDYIPKPELLRRLKKESPDFLARCLNLEIPKSPDRLRIPVVETADKIDASKMNQSDLETFLDECCHFVAGQQISLGDFYNKFRDWLSPERKAYWTKQKITRHMPDPVVKGRLMADAGKHYYGNISWEPFRPDQQMLTKYESFDDKLIGGDPV